MNRTIAHQKLVDDVLFALGSLPFFRVWKNVNGFATPLHSERTLWFGSVKGAGDISGLISPRGRRLEIECKTGSGRLTEEQENFRDMIIRFGGAYILARSVEQTVQEAMDEYRKEKSA